jgi:hypothetical protein
MKVLERGPYQGYSHEELAAIRNAYQPQLGMAADEYVQALDNAMRAIWREQREQAWRADGLDPGLGHFDGESKPAYTRGSHAGPWCFRVVVWKEEHPELQLAQDRLQTIRNALLSDQLEYLEGFKGK